MNKLKTKLDVQELNKFCSVCKSNIKCLHKECPLRIFFYSVMLAEEKHLGVKEATKLTFRQQSDA